MPGTVLRLTLAGEGRSLSLPASCNYYLEVAVASPALFARVFQCAMSASLLNITRTPLAPRLTRTLPPFRAL